MSNDINPTWPPAPANGLTEDVIFEASALYESVQGREAVQTLMKTVSEHYRSLDFTAQTIDGNVTYLQWVAILPSGTEVRGVSVLTRNDEGLIEHVSVHQRPLGALHEFSAGLRDRLSAVVPESAFYREPPNA